MRNPNFFVARSENARSRIINTLHSHPRIGALKYKFLISLNSEIGIKKRKTKRHVRNFVFNICAILLNLKFQVAKELEWEASSEAWFPQLWIRQNRKKSALALARYEVSLRILDFAARQSAMEKRCRTQRTGKP